MAIVGAGPIGLELAVALRHAGIDTLHFEARQIGETIFRWPANTQFFSSPERIAIAGVPFQNVDQQKATGEDYLAYLRAIVEQFDLPIHTYEPVIDILRQPEGFELLTKPQTGERTFRCRRLVLATGGMALPKRLGIPGEGLPHVSHGFDDPHTFFRKRLVVVGGRNSALETALRCWRCGAHVTISYRRVAFDSELVKPHLLREIELLLRERRLRFLPATRPTEITPRHIILVPSRPGSGADRPSIIEPADFVVLATGFTADTRLFETAGVGLEGDQNAPRFSSETMETNIPGLYVAGVAVAGSQRQYRLFIENCHEHVEKIVAAITGKPRPASMPPEDREFEV